MYTVFLNNTCILDPTKELFINDPVLDLAENSAGSFSFDIYEDNPGYELAQQPLSTFVTIKRDGELFWHGRVIDHARNFYNGQSIECEGDLAFLDDSIQEPARYQDYTIHDYLQKLLDHHNSNVEEEKRIFLGLVTVGEEDYNSLYRFTNFESTLTCIKEDLVDDFGGHLRLRYVDGVRYLDYLKDYPRVTDQKIEFGENLLDFTESATARDLATAVIPVGAVIEDEEFVEGLDKRVTIEDVNDGSRELVIPEAINRYGKITKTVQFDGVNTPSVLKQKGQEWLEDNQYENVVLKITAIDLADFGLHDDHINLLDSVVCTSKPHGMNRQFPLCEMKIYLLDPEKNKYTLGTTTKRYTVDASKAEKRIESIAQDTGNSVYKKAQDYVQQLMNLNGKNGHIVYGENEMLIMDTTDIETAQNIWRFNVAGWAHSSTGYEGPFNAATTQDGLILGQMLVAGSVSTEQISSVYRDSVTEAITSIDLKQDQLSLEVSNKVDEDNLISSINMSSEEIAIQADKIKLEGMISANGDFKITEAGTCRARALIVDAGMEIFSDNSSSNRTAYIDFHTGTYNGEDFTSRVSCQEGVMWIWDNNGSGGQQPGALQTGPITHGGIQARSDIRLKKDVCDLDPRQSYDLLMNLKPKSYRLKADWDTRLHHGLIYQDIATLAESDWSVLGSLKEDGETYGAIDYTQLIPDLISTIQYQDQRLRELEMRIINMEDKQ